MTPKMSMALARALIANGNDDLDTLMTAVARQFVAWSQSEDNNRGPGRTCMTACARLAAGVPWREAGRNSSKGCGTAMRAASVGLRYHGDRARIIRVAEAQSLCTHGHPCATAGSVAVALCVDLALSQQPPTAWIGPVLEATQAYGEEFGQAIGRALESGGDAQQRLREIGEGWVAEEAVAAALSCVLSSPSDYRRTVLLAANTDGDSDSIACIAGAMSGALNGLQAIPPEWQAGVEDSAGLLELAEALYQHWASDYAQ